MAQTPSRDPGFEREVSEHFAFIASAPPPRILESRYDVQSFGNAVVVLAGDALRVRVTRDRSEFLVGLSPADRYDWVDEQIVLQFVGAEAERRSLIDGNFRALGQSAAAIRRHLPQILAAFQPSKWPQTRAALTELQRRRAQLLFCWNG
jgi:hypothetical protein